MRCGGKADGAAIVNKGKLYARNIEASGFARAIAAYIADPALRRAHGAAGELASRAYSWDAINGAVADAYLRLIAARSA